MGRPLTQCGVAAFGREAGSLATEVRGAPPLMKTGEFVFRRGLPYEGQIFVQPGDAVETSTVVGQNTFTPPRIYIVDMQRLVGYQHELTQQEIDEGILVKVGDKINAGERMFRFSGGILGGHYYCNSPVRGHVRQIEKNGMVILREIQDYTDKPVKVDIARALDVKPKQIRRHLSFSVGDFVQRGEELARVSGKMFPVRAPTTGTLKEINTADGSVILQYDLKPIVLRSFVRGKVTRCDRQLFAEVAGAGTILHGMIGFGPESVGELRLLRGGEQPGADLKGKVVVSFDPVHESALKTCARIGVSGLIAPSMNCLDWVSFAGKEIGVALTGDEDIPFAIILTEGFGRVTMNAAYQEFLKRAEGREASVTGRTQIRAGVTRPMAIVGD
jgi:hypothetical protein